MARVRIVLDIFSGRPNPSWELSDEQVESLRRRLEESRQDPRAERREPPYLGYRGFVIRNPELAAGLPYEAEVVAGSVAVTETQQAASGEARESRMQFFGDLGGIHDWLLEQAVELGHGKDIAATGGPDTGRGRA